MPNRAATRYVRKQYRRRPKADAVRNATALALRLSDLAKIQIVKIGAERDPGLIERLLRIGRKATARALRLGDKDRRFYRYRAGFDR